MQFPVHTAIAIVTTTYQGFNCRNDQVNLAILGTREVLLSRIRDDQGIWISWAQLAESLIPEVADATLRSRLSGEVCGICLLNLPYSL